MAPADPFGGPTSTGPLAQALFLQRSGSREVQQASLGHLWALVLVPLSCGTLNSTPVTLIARASGSESTANVIALLICSRVL